MASGDDLGISFRFSHSQQSFRLLELPPPLLELLSSDNPPTLSLKSAKPSSISNGPNSPVSSNAVLCTNNQTFHLRQVHSSNSIFLIHPSGNHTLHSGQQSATSDLSITATCKATLELHPTNASPIPYLNQHLALYNGGDDELETLNGIDSSPENYEKVNKLEVFSHVPFSEGECESAWTEICAFEIQNVAMRPTARALAGVWKAIISGATSQALRLSSEFQLDDLWTIVEDDGYPRSLIEAVLGRLSSEEGTEGACLDQKKCVKWVGTIILGSQKQSSAGVPVSRFLKDWKDSLPEEWQKYAILDVLKGSFLQPTATTILPREIGANLAVAKNPSPKPNAPASKVSAGGRRWHEKFKATRQ
ncbi:MAG: hypothetical protein M1812_001975 [Candelaria pacifica]|nr:MAG: hypothetical protein M1812_001975 [Candelaria pacifica]